MKYLRCAMVVSLLALALSARAQTCSALIRTAAGPVSVNVQPGYARVASNSSFFASAANVVVSDDGATAVIDCGVGAPAYSYAYTWSPFAFWPGAHARITFTRTAVGVVVTSAGGAVLLDSGGLQPIIYGSGSP